MATSSVIAVAGSFFLGSFFSLVTIINPPSALPLFTALAAGMDAREQRALARRACVYVFFILIGSLFAGGLVLHLFGVSYAALRVAGGICVLLLGHGMLFGRSEAEAGARGVHANPAFFPLALPGLSGPGTIAVAIGISTEIRELRGLPAELSAYVGTVAAILATCLVSWLVLRSARAVSQRLGTSGIEVLTRLMGFVLLCVGVQFIASGIRSFAAGA